ncbi:glycine cleavage system protein R [Aestuariibacter halophilus]|uniref:Glycine cleavage system transcriptional repressor n=1 Tax=Fluctibacter halophilus TaxID=226011 RepID=A0ABS8GC37_9ALTE|nr:ACT domain-containing protein [Aestuariibacter halophilus]MCC2618058.1 glycine cleavage system protein R [Aestuariibacter halophilus]
MKTLIFTLVGKDKPGLIDSVARTVYQLGGNWLGSNFSHMAGHFAGFVHIELPAEQHQTLIDTFEKHPDLDIHLVEGEPSQTHLPATAIVEVTGNDKPGIVQELTNVLNRFNINIRRFDTSCESAPNWGSQLFKATARIDMPDNFDTDALRAALEDIANDLMVDLIESDQ